MLLVSAAFGYGGVDGSRNAESASSTSPDPRVNVWANPARLWKIEEAPAAAIETATPELEPTPEPWATMVVRSGDSFNSLAEWFGVSGTDIAAANGVDIEYVFHPGDTLVIPIPASLFTMPPELPVYVYEEPAKVTYTYEAPVVEDLPPPPPPARISSQSDVVAAICSLPWSCETMVRIATCESGLNPNSHNPAGYYGLFQISGAFDGWDDPWVNARVAYEQKYLPALAAGDRLSPWPHCRYF